MKLLLNTLLALGIFVSLNLTTIQAQDQATENTPTTSELESSEIPLLKTYPWLKELVNTTKANNEVVSEYNLNGTAFIIVESAETTKMYDADGKVYCYNHPDLNCKEFYKLGEPKDTWTNKKQS